MVSLVVDYETKVREIFYQCQAAKNSEGFNEFFEARLVEGVKYLEANLDAQIEEFKQQRRKIHGQKNWMLSDDLRDEESCLLDCIQKLNNLHANVDEIKALFSGDSGENAKKNGGDGQPVGPQ